MNAWNFQELKETPSQTGGPYVHIGLLPQQANIEVFEHNFDNQLVNEQTQGQRIRLEGQVFDGLGLPLRDVLLEIWQADAQGIYAHPEDPRSDDHDPAFDGWGRVPTDEQGRFGIFGGRFVAETLMPLILDLEDAVAPEQKQAADRTHRTLRKGRLPRAAIRALGDGGRLNKRPLQRRAQ